jgi:hypothetical protein
MVFETHDGFDRLRFVPSPLENEETKKVKAFQFISFYSCIYEYIYTSTCIYIYILHYYLFRFILHCHLHPTVYPLANQFLVMKKLANFIVNNIFSPNKKY